MADSLIAVDKQLEVENFHKATKAQFTSVGYTH